MMEYRFMKPIPMPRAQKYGSAYIIFKSYKLSRKVTAYSNLEYENLITLEMDPEVEYYCEQPFKCSVRDEDGKLCESYFDTWVLYRDGREEFQEVKYNSEVNNPDKYQRSWKQICIQKKWCELNNENYVVRTDKDIYLGRYYMENLHLMAARVRRFSIPKDYQKEYEKNIILLLESRYATVEVIVDTHILPAGREAEVLSMLYYKGLILFSNIEDNFINQKTEVYLRG